MYSFLKGLLICSSLDPAIVPTSIPGHDPVTQSMYYSTLLYAFVSQGLGTAKFM